MGYDKIVYLLLSALSGFIEIGAVIYVYQRSQSLLAAVGFGLLYQIGPLTTHPIRLQLWWYLVASALGLFAFFVGDSFPIQGFSLVMLSIALHGLRELSPGRSQVSTALKRWSRVGGFLISGVFTAAVIPVACGICLMVGGPFSSKLQSTRQTMPVRLREGPIAWVMLVHQLHYFVYAYALPCAFLSIYKQPGWLTALWFSLGWLSYTLAEKLLGKFNNSLVVVSGHLFAAVALFLLSATLGSSLTLTVSLWFLTGFGGGTVYAVRRIAHIQNDLSDLDSWENLGHVGGVLVGVVFLAIVPSIEVVFAVAGLLAIAAAICFRGIDLSVRTGTRRNAG